MIKRFALLSAAILLVTLAACNTAESNKETATASSSPPPAAASASASVPAKPPEEPDNPVDAKYISFQLPQGWTTQNGEESFAFDKDGKTVGGLDGLGYSDTTAGLLPNGATVDSEQEVSGMPVKTVEVVLSPGDGEQSGERHYFFFLEKQKVVYDLHFDAKQVSAEEALTVAKTAAVRSS